MVPVNINLVTGESSCASGGEFFTQDIMCAQHSSLHLCMVFFSMSKTVRTGAHKRTGFRPCAKSTRVAATTSSAEVKQTTSEKRQAFIVRGWTDERPTPSHLDTIRKSLDVRREVLKPSKATPGGEIKESEGHEEQWQRVRTAFQVAHEGTENAAHCCSVSSRGAPWRSATPFPP